MSEDPNNKSDFLGLARSEAFTLGIVVSAFLTSVVLAIIFSGAIIAILGGLAYLAVGALVAIKLVLRNQWARQTQRELFYLPFFPWFILPMLVASYLIVEEWKLDQPVWRALIIGALFLITLPSILLYFKLTSKSK